MDVTDGIALVAADPADAAAEPRDRVEVVDALPTNRYGVGLVRAGAGWAVRATRIENVRHAGDPAAVLTR
ncbi:hypothetical protein GCM10010123_06620 [Pilimelia anulata]|uniref:Uncharacterized protein n=1 Tax=Pilimelia anulata TaxID=53371 RepID=A0A8J3F7R3_9ACTN|nr:hypothetical protein [Pilimelia anulata]GGJ79334.1 hypothetical protein GCM10010123_06620 [Pilimelia anulata]